MSDHFRLKFTKMSRSNPRGAVFHISLKAWMASLLNCCPFVAKVRAKKRLGVSAVVETSYSKEGNLEAAVRVILLMATMSMTIEVMRMKPANRDLKVPCIITVLIWASSQRQSSLVLCDSLSFRIDEQDLLFQAVCGSKPMDQSLATWV